MMKYIFKQCTLLLVLLIFIGCKEDYKKSSNTYDYELEEGIRQQAEKEKRIDELLINLSDKYRRDWLIQRISNPHTSVSDRYNYNGVGAYDDMKSLNFYWNQEGVRSYFKETFGTQAKWKFDEFYKFTIDEFLNFKKGIYSPNKSGYEIIKDDLSDLESY